MSLAAPLAEALANALKAQAGPDVIPGTLPKGIFYAVFLANFNRLANHDKPEVVQEMHLLLDQLYSNVLGKAAELEAVTP